MWEGILRGFVEERDEGNWWLKCFFGSSTEVLSSAGTVCHERKMGEKDELSPKLLGFGGKRGSLLSGCGCPSLGRRDLIYSRWKLLFSKKP